MKGSLFMKTLIVSLLFVIPVLVFSKVAEVKLITNAHCEGCKAKIEKALKKVDGVQEASLDLPSKVAFVKFDDEKTKVENLISALQKVGYDAKVYEGEKEYELQEHQDADCKGKKDDPKCKEHKSKTNNKEKK